MKILAVKFKNINTLLGEWEIRFDKPPLSDTGLFAIVGPNGSGKSSILDALTLALYGETARLRSPESGVTGWRADEASSEVTFSVGDLFYRSRWSMRKSGGVWEAPEMCLAGVNNGHETLLEDRLIRVRSRMAELTGLDFKRFCRSVLLAQGDFAAFLNALENERAEILEKIMGSEMAQELEESIGKQVREEQEKLLRLKESAASFPVVDKARVNDLRQSHEQAEEELLTARARLRELQELAALREARERLENERREAMERLAAAESEWSAARLEAQKLDMAGAASPLRGSIDRLDALWVELNAARERLSRLQADIPVQEARLPQLQETHEQTLAELDEARRQLEDRATELTDASACDHEIEAESRRFLETVSRYETLDRELKENLEQQAQVAEQISQAEGRRSDILRWLERHRHEESLGTDLAVLDEEVRRLAEIEVQIGQFRAQQSEAEKNEGEAAQKLDRSQRVVFKAQGKVDGLARRQNEREERLTELLNHMSFEDLTAAVQDHKRKLAAGRELTEIGRRAQDLASLSELLMESARIEVETDILIRGIEAEKAALKELESRILYRELVRKLSTERPSLTAGSPCPLCGALDHPFVQKGLPDFSELDGVVEGHTRKLEALQGDLEKLQAERETLLSQVDELKALESRWADVCNRAGLDWTLSGVDQVRDRVKVLEEEIKQWVSGLRSARWLKWRMDWAKGSLRRKNEKLLERERERDADLERHEACRNVVAGILDRIEGLRSEDESIRMGMGVRVQPYGETSPDTGAERELIQRLAKRRDEYLRRRNDLESTGGELEGLHLRQQELPREYERLHEEVRGLAAETETLQGRIADLKARRDMRFGALDPGVERQTLEDKISRLENEEDGLAGEIEQLRQSLNEWRAALPGSIEEDGRLQSELEEVEARLHEEMRTAGFSELVQVRSQLAVLDETESILNRVNAVEQDLDNARSRVTEVEAALETVSKSPLTEESLEGIRVRIGEEEKQCESLQARLEESERALREIRDAEHEHREILAAIAVQEKVYDETLVEQKLLRMRDAAETMKKRQRLMLNRLLDRANEHLALLSGRYLLRCIDQDGLGMDVEDAFQGRVRRAVKTLSGGESFQVSLCLALGLAEMAASHRKIESLFLDEGFGALDDEMLYKVMAALKGLRANGRMVGIISHVKRLADEIPTQIRVDRAPDGSSRITVVA